jgi:methylmalonic acid semialdehyde dehydrogenase
MSTNIVNWIDNAEHQPAQNAHFMDVVCPANGEVIAKVLVSDATEVDLAVASCKKAFPAWSGLNVKTRAQKLHRLFELIRDNADELAESIMKEHGKSRPEALAEVAKGNETAEYAASMQLLSRGNVMEVSRGVKCEDGREPLGVVAHIVPFNFPLMVPFWVLPIAIATGNCIVLKPSEKVPITMSKVARLIKAAGIPDGVVNIVNGTKEAVSALMVHPDIQAVTFVGSTPVARLVASTCSSHGKRVLALGGAKNFLVALPDCEPEATAADVVASFTGCAGQRCMAASVLVIVGDDKFGDDLLQRIVQKAKAIEPGQEKAGMGPVIDDLAVARITKYLKLAEESGSTIALDGRSWQQSNTKGYWMGPSIIVHKSPANPADPIITDEIFGPVISVVRVASRSEALALEHTSPFGNAACVYTSSGANAEWFSKQFSAAMIGVNIGVPVPREPFSFGGMGVSKFGNHGDITGQSAVDFFTRLRKVTTRWPVAGNHDNQPWFK